MNHLETMTFLFFQVRYFSRVTLIIFPLGIRIRESAYFCSSGVKMLRNQKIRIFRNILFIRKITISSVCAVPRICFESDFFYIKIFDYETSKNIKYLTRNRRSNSKPLNLIGHLVLFIFSC